MRAEVSFVEQAAPGLVSLKYDPATDTVLDAGRVLDKKQVGQRLREEISRSKEEWSISEPDRVGIATALRYLAEKSILPGSEAGRRDSLGGHNQGTLRGVLYAAPQGREFKDTHNRPVADFNQKQKRDNPLPAAVASVQRVLGLLYADSLQFLFLLLQLFKLLLIQSSDGFKRLRLLIAG